MQIEKFSQQSCKYIYIYIWMYYRLYCTCLYKNFYTNKWISGTPRFFSVVKQRLDIVLPLLFLRWLATITGIQFFI